MLGINAIAKKIVDNLCENAVLYGVLVKETRKGAKIIDAGIKANGGFVAGRIITEICLGGCGVANIFSKNFDDLELPTIFVSTDHPALATLGSQFAGWRIALDDYFAMGSGPARSLSLKPINIYTKIQYQEKSQVAILVLETSKEPPDEVVDYISRQCNVNPESLILIITPTSSITGSVQISGRIVETGIHKLMELGLDPKKILYACGSAPIVPVHPKFPEAMGRTNDSIIYAGVVQCVVNYDNDSRLMELVNITPSSASKNYGRPFIELFREANFDFYKIDPGLFAPAEIIITNIKTGSIFRAGKINVDILKRSIGLEI